MSKHTERIGVVVVGGGAAGLVAAIMAARNGAKVLILEHNEVPGKKILATGNGKCNYTNKVQGVDKYYGQNPAFVAPVFEQFGLEETLQFFKELGIYPKERRILSSERAGNCNQGCVADGIKETERWSGLWLWHKRHRKDRKGLHFSYQGR